VSFEGDFFDVVLMEEVIEHLVNPDNAIKETRRILGSKVIGLKGHI
jgi:2-polyprenyl-3-methyl-5-hydroxy-6-metoxy-1,4-benzoquinol methylase